MNPAEYDWKSLAHGALGGLLVLTFVCVAALLMVREFWLWAKQHLSTFENINVAAKGGKIQLGATIEDVRGKPPDPPKLDGTSGAERDHLSLS